MTNCLLRLLLIGFACLFIQNSSISQNRNFIVSLSLGAGNSGFNIAEEGIDELSSIFYPMGGLQFQKRLSPKWALNIFPNVGLSGNKRTFPENIWGITSAKSTSAFVNLAIHPKYYISNSFYISAGPELAYLLWNRGSTYIGDERQTNIDETDAFYRANLLMSSSIGYSQKVESSRKNAPIQIDALWYIEFRFKKGLTNILRPSDLIDIPTTSITSFELVTGISFASQD